ncbi:MAG TPA: hypothetical protein VGU63_12885 [Candidatus Acidoferrales bacterium]|nr:hypothetical protein [Candidatus Acidoferrales bacterium]
MKLYGLATVLAVAVLSAIPSVPASAQQKPGKVTVITELTPKSGAEKQFEDGLKQLAAWRASVNDPQSHAVFEQITGENFGTYLLVRRWTHWADLDKPVAQVDAEEAKDMGDTIAKIVRKVYEEIPELDHPARSSRPLKYYDIETFHVPLAKQGQFAAAMARFREAVEKTKASVDVSFLALDEGGQFGTWQVVFGHDSWADFGGPTPDQILVNAFGKAEGTAIVNEVSDVVGGSFTMDVVEFRPELSYFPKK